MRRAVGILIFPGVEELDFVGPWEIFSFLGHLEPAAGSVFTVSEEGGEVRCAKGLRVIADHSFRTAPGVDVLIVPGGVGTRTEVENGQLIDFIRRCGESAEVVASVCTGTFLLERAGLLAGRQASTHWRSLDRLRALGTVEVVEARWVDEGRVVTAAGVSAGIDMSLYLVGRLWSPELARRVQHGVEYFPAPPYGDVPL
jgi:transcriptional regulator GlxA family with amidase domain